MKASKKNEETVTLTTFAKLLHHENLYAHQTL